MISLMLEIDNTWLQDWFVGFSANTDGSEELASGAQETFMEVVTVTFCSGNGVLE